MTLGDPKSKALTAALEHQRDLVTRAPANKQTFAARVLGAPETRMLEVRVRFAELPQRALAPRLLANGHEVGFPLGRSKEGAGGVELTFVVLPQLIGSVSLHPKAPVELAVQMGDDPRTKSLLNAPELEKSLRDLLSPH
jgi:hypothetical protein